MRVILVACLLACTLTTGCAAVVVAGAAAGGMSLHDRRSLGNQVDDASIEIKARARLRDDPEVEQQTRIQVVSYNGVVLLTGEAPTTDLRDRILAEIRAVPNIQRIVNGIRIAPPMPFGDRTTDAWITAKVKTDLIRAGLDPTRIKVVTNNRNVYLMGLVTTDEGAKATEIARMVSQVKRVIVLFEHPT